MMGLETTLETFTPEEIRKYKEQLESDRKSYAEWQFDELKRFIEYVFVTVWKPTHEIPELVGSREIRETLGISVYTHFGLKCGNLNQLLEKVFDDYGKLDDEKCRVFIETKDTGKRHTLSKAFFSGDDREK